MKIVNMAGNRARAFQPGWVCYHYTNRGNLHREYLYLCIFLSGTCKNGTGAIGCGPQEEFRSRVFFFSKIFKSLVLSVRVLVCVRHCPRCPCLYAKPLDDRSVACRVHKNRNYCKDKTQYLMGALYIFHLPSATNGTPFVELATTRGISNTTIGC